ncbi:MAG: hypothetical protein LCH82_01730 [Actinobacteria bacterium]|nr:hypothetical protein [Actinomycetota bacterium]
MPSTRPTARPCRCSVCPSPSSRRSTSRAWSRPSAGRAIPARRPPWNLTGHPAIVLPLGRTSAGIPLAVQVVGRFGRDLDLIDVATRLEALVTEAPSPRSQPRRGRGWQRGQLKELRFMKCSRRIGVSQRRHGWPPRP